MCFYIYAPEGNIEIEFITESIYLRPFGGSKIFADILIKNNSPISSGNLISELILLVPKVFMKVRRREEGPLTQCGEFSNLTDKLKNRYDPINQTYRGSGLDLNFDEVNLIRITRPNPNDLNEPFVYEGEIFDDDQKSFEIIPGLHDKAYIFLSYIGFSIFKYRFKVNIEPGKKRWIRLLVCPKMAAINNPNSFRKVFLWCIDNLKFNYEIVGPFDVLNMFMERINIQAWQTNILREKARGKNELEFDRLTAQLRAISQIDRQIIGPLNKSKAIFKHLTIHIFSGKLRMLQSLYSVGRILPKGTLPNYLPENNTQPFTPSWKRRVYDWEYDDINNPEEDTFRLYFTGHSVNRPFRLIFFLVIFSVIMTQVVVPIVNFILNIFNLVKISYYFEKVINWIFFDHPLIAFGLGIFIPILINVIRTKLKKRK